MLAFDSLSLSCSGSLYHSISFSFSLTVSPSLSCVWVCMHPWCAEASGIRDACFVRSSSISYLKLPNESHFVSALCRGPRCVRVRVCMYMCVSASIRVDFSLCLRLACSHSLCHPKIKRERERTHVYQERVLHPGQRVLQSRERALQYQ